MINRKHMVVLLALTAFFCVSTAPVFAESTVRVGKLKPSYSENEFLDAFSGKSRKIVRELLGEPVKKEQSIKPSNADGITAQVGRSDESRPASVEMWYYQNLVKYNAKKTYKSVELTFVNDRCMNIAFFNDR